MTLPTRSHAIFSTLQGTQNPDTKPTLQRAKNANAQAPTPAEGIFIIFTFSHQQTNYHQQHSALPKINYTSRSI